MIRCDHRIRGQTVKCTKSQIRKLKTALRWKLPAAQRELFVGAAVLANNLMIVAALLTKRSARRRKATR